ncbi:unnamed protein product, partial [Ectocarpus fasciculatus]
MWPDFRLALEEVKRKLLETVDTAEGTPSGALARTPANTMNQITSLKVKTSSSNFATPADWIASLPRTWGPEVVNTLEVPSFFRTVDGVHTWCDSCFTNANVDFAGAAGKSVLSLKRTTRRLSARIYCNGFNALVHHDCAQFVKGLRTNSSIGDNYKCFDKENEDTSWLSGTRLPRTSADRFVEEQLRASLVEQGATANGANPVYVRMSTQGCQQSASRVDCRNQRRACRFNLEDGCAPGTTPDGDYPYHRLPREDLLEHVTLVVRKRKLPEALDEAHSSPLRALARRLDKLEAMPASSFFLELAAITDSWQSMSWANKVVPDIRAKATVVKGKLTAAEGNLLNESLGGL